MYKDSTPGAEKLVFLNGINLIYSPFPFVPLLSSHPYTPSPLLPLLYYSLFYRFDYAKTCLCSRPKASSGGPSSNNEESSPQPAVATVSYYLSTSEKERGKRGREGERERGREGNKRQKQKHFDAVRYGGVRTLACVVRRRVRRAMGLQILRCVCLRHHHECIFRFGEGERNDMLFLDHQ